MILNSPSVMSYYVLPISFIFLFVRFKSPNAKEQTDQELTGDLLSMRDLLSFAWQIAKGMSYLSEIKVMKT